MRVALAVIYERVQIKFGYKIKSEKLLKIPSVIGSYQMPMIRIVWVRDEDMSHVVQVAVVTLVATNYRGLH